jgi:hypothetical protein
MIPDENEKEHKEEKETTVIGSDPLYKQKHVPVDVKETRRRIHESDGA